MTDREAFEAWYDAQPDGRIQPWDVWQAATAAKEAEIAALKAEWEALLKDAERYRWLRRTTNWVSSKGERIDVRNCPDLWDESIDAAIAKAEGGEA